MNFLERCQPNFKAINDMICTFFFLFYFFCIFLFVPYDNDRMSRTFHTIQYCTKSARIRSYTGPHFPTFGLNTERRENADLNNSEYGHFLRSDNK